MKKALGSLSIILNSFFKSIDNIHTLNLKNNGKYT